MPKLSFLKTSVNFPLKFSGTVLSFIIIFFFLVGKIEASSGGVLFSQVGVALDHAIKSVDGAY